MPITLRVPGELSVFTDGRAVITLPNHSCTVRDVFQSLWSLHPGLHDRIVDEQGEIRQHINVFVGKECIRFTGGLTMPLPEVADISIMPALGPYSTGSAD
jgi:molybdopterin synthase sulfur carrier subunit